jgi:hypothetical protein
MQSVMFKKGQLFYSPKQNNIFKIEEISSMNKGIMYTVKYLNPRKDGSIYSKYYQDRMDEFQEISNTKAKRAVKAIYGAVNE